MVWAQNETGKARNACEDMSSGLRCASLDLAMWPKSDSTRKSLSPDVDALCDAALVP